MPLTDLDPKQRKIETERLQQIDELNSQLRSCLGIEDESNLQLNSFLVPWEVCFGGNNDEFLNDTSEGKCPYFLVIMDNKDPSVIDNCKAFCFKINDPINPVEEVAEVGGSEILGFLELPREGELFRINFSEKETSHRYTEGDYQEDWELIKMSYFKSRQQISILKVLIKFTKGLTGE